MLIVGMGRVGTAAYDAVARGGGRPVGLDIDPARIQAHRNERRRVIYGDATDPELWKGLEPDAVDAVIMAVVDPDAEEAAAAMLRERGFAGEIHALAMRPEHGERLRAAGVSTICHPLVQAGIELAESSLARRVA